MMQIYAAYSLQNPILCTAVFITLVPLIFLIFKKAYKDRTFRLLGYYLTFKLAIDIMMFHSASLHRNNIILYNLSIPVFYALLSGMFYQKLVNPFYKKLIVFSIIIFTGLSSWDIFNANPNLSDLHNHRAVIFSKTIEGVLMISIVLVYFYEVIKSLQIPNLLTFPFFWICSGLLLYYSSMIFIAPVLHYTATWTNTLELGMTEYVPYIFEIICAILFTIGIYYFPRFRYAKQ